MILQMRFGFHTDEPIELHQVIVTEIATASLQQPLARVVVILTVAFPFVCLAAVAVADKKDWGYWQQHQGYTEKLEKYSKSLVWFIGMFA